MDSDSKLVLLFLVAFICSTIILVHILVLSRYHVDASKWNKQDIHQHAFSGKTPVPLSACTDNQPVFADTDFAVMSMNSGAFQRYGVSAMKLANTVRRFTDVDMIMMSIEGRSMTSCQQKQMEAAGWKICTVPAIQGPPTSETNRFLEALMYSKFNAWQFIEYKGILLLDSDTLVVGDITPAFTNIIPLMQKTKKSIAAARDRPPKVTVKCTPGSTHFNAGVILLIPSAESFNMLKQSIASIPHSVIYAEQELLNIIYYKTAPFNKELHELPFAYNAVTLSKTCEPDVWVKQQSHIKIVHYTTAKGWTYSTHWHAFEDPFLCWWWDVQDLCLLWESIPIPINEDKCVV